MKPNMMFCVHCGAKLGEDNPDSQVIIISKGLSYCENCAPDNNERKHKHTDIPEDGIPEFIRNYGK